MNITKVGKNQNKITVINEAGNPVKFKAVRSTDASWNGCGGCAFAGRVCPDTDKNTKWKGTRGEEGYALCSEDSRADCEDIIWVEVSDENVE